jgi:hypothetical protein
LSRASHACGGKSQSKPLGPAEQQDIRVVQGILLVLVTAFVVVNLLVDVLYAVLDAHTNPVRRTGPGGSGSTRTSCPAGCGNRS